MGYNRLGRSGLKVSKIILGAMSFGSIDWQKWVLEEDEALPLLAHAYKAGINTWDTVSIYTLVTSVLTSPVPNFQQLTFYTLGRSLF
jgi:aryl-alcohol dehydrogenase-like predicted oxidoreductase